MKEAYYYLYYKLYKFAVSISDDAINEWKPLLTILLLEILLIVECLIWYSIATKRIIVIDNPFVSFLPIVGAIAIANYFIFLHNDKWKEYEKQFKDYDRSKGKVGGILVIITVVVILTSVIYSFFELSKINWKQYQ